MLLAVTALFISLQASASPVQELTTGIKNEHKGLFSFMDLSAEYKGSTDLNREERPRLYKHSLGLTASKTLAEKYNVSLSAGVTYQTLNTDVTRENVNDAYFDPNDIGISAFRNFKLDQDTNSLAVILGTDILNSEDSRYRGYRATGSAQSVLTTRIANWVSLKNSLTGVYLWNRYRYSPVGSEKVHIGDISSDGFVAYSLRPVIKVFKGMNFTPAMSVRGTHYMDNTNTYNFGNSYTLSYSHANWSGYLTYINNGYADRGETNLWFVDRYKSLASAGFTYNF